MCKSDRDFLVHCFEKLIEGKTLAYFEKCRIWKILEME